MRVTNRFEYKYILDIRQFQAFKNHLQLYMDKGHFTKMAPNHRYLVRSLYYDTFDYQHYLESEEGQYSRIKLRVRTYDYFLEQAKVISIEIKTKQGIHVKKYSELISPQEYLYFLEHKRFSKSTLILDEFMRLMNLQQLEPKLVVEYDREGYISKDGTDLRLTFDYEVKSKLSNQLFDYNHQLMNRHHHGIICEIKCGMDKPEWLEHLIRKYGLRVKRNSKYTQAVKLIRPEILIDKF